MLLRRLSQTPTGECARNNLSRLLRWLAGVSDTICEEKKPLPVLATGRFTRGYCRIVNLSEYARDRRCSQVYELGSGSSARGRSRAGTKN